MAWYRALRSLGETFPIWRIHRLIGMGGDKLVTALAGEEVEARIGDEARERQGKEVDALLDEIAPLPGARDLLVAHQGARAPAGAGQLRAAAARRLRARPARRPRPRRRLDLQRATPTRPSPRPDLLQVALKKLGAPADAPSVMIEGFPLVLAWLITYCCRIGRIKLGRAGMQRDERRVRLRREIVFRTMSKPLGKYSTRCVLNGLEHVGVVGLPVAFDTERVNVNPVVGGR